MSRTVSTWSCPRCGTAAFAEQNFCRHCGTPRPSRPAAPITTQLPAIEAEPEPPLRRPTKRLSRLGLIFVALLFLVIGGFAALVVNDMTADDAVKPTPTNPTTPPAVHRGGVQVTTTVTTG